MKTALHLLKVVVVCYGLAFTSHSVNRYLAQRDEIVKINKFNSMIMMKAIDAQNSVHCAPG